MEKEIVWNEGQQAASDKFSEFVLNPKKKYFVLTGPAGTGKSTLVKYLTEVVNKRIRLANVMGMTTLSELKFFYTSTTNKAVEALSRATGIDSISTIHSALGLKPRNNFKTGEVDYVPDDALGLIEFEPNTLVIVDEGSFVSQTLAEYIDEASHGCKVLYVGDSYQLAPIGQDFSIIDTIDDECKAELTEVMRNTDNILNYGTAYRECLDTKVFPPIPTGCPDIIHADQETFVKLMVESFKENQHDTQHTRVLAWTNERVNNYNKLIRKHLGKPTLLENGEIVVTNNAIAAQNVVFAKNEDFVPIGGLSKETFERDVPGRYMEMRSRGITQSFFLPNDSNDLKAVLADLAANKKWKEYFTVKETWLDLRPWYASTVHKSQGSTFDTVFIDLFDIAKNRKPEEFIRLMYVAITRASKRVVIYGNLPKHYGG